MTSTQATIQATPESTGAVDMTMTTSSKPRGEAAGITKRTSAYFADPKQIKRKEGFNVRFDFGEITELAASIKAQGMIQPLQVQRVGDNLILVDGDRRLSACELIMKTEPDFFEPDGVPIITVDKKLTEVELTVRMLSANSGKNFLPLEEAAAYKRLRDAKMTLKQICDAVGRKHVHVVATLALLDADQSVKDAVKDGSVNSTLAKKIAVVARGDAAKQKELVADVKAAGKNKKARKVAQQKIEDTRQARAKKEGRVLKMRALTDEQLSAIGIKMSEVLMAQMVELGLEVEADVHTWVKAGDLDQKAAFTFGILTGLKAAAGLPVDLLTD